MRVAGDPITLAGTVLQRENEIIDRMRKLSMLSMEVKRIRCHGDYHLGQVLWTGRTS